jgi:hypothetical protein
VNQPGHQFRLIDIGRNRFNGIATANSGAELLKAVCRHLASSNVSITAEGVVLAGMRNVGRVEGVGDVAAAQFKRWLEP